MIIETLDMSNGNPYEIPLTDTDGQHALMIDICFQISSETKWLAGILHVNIVDKKVISNEYTDLGMGRYSAIPNDDTIQIIIWSNEDEDSIRIVHKIHYMWLKLENIGICQAIFDKVTLVEELQKENAILHELVDHPDSAGAKFSYEEIAKVLR